MFRLFLGLRGLEVPFVVSLVIAAGVGASAGEVAVVGDAGDSTVGVVEIVVAGASLMGAAGVCAHSGEVLNSRERLARERADKRMATSRGSGCTRRYYA
jgi:hypothetical protein